MKICGIYKITNIVNNKVMIGQSKDITLRWRNYKTQLKYNKWHNLHLQRAWNKYGEQNFKFEVILECPIETLDKEEIRLIEEYNSRNDKYGYNIKEGGDRHAHSEETKRRISEKHKGKVLSPEHRAKLCLARRKRITSAETKEKISQSSKGKIVSEETRLKLSIANKGKQILFSEEQKAKLVARLKNPSKETREKMSVSHIGKVQSEEAKQKNRLAHLNKPKSEEFKQKIKKSWILRRLKKLTQILDFQI